MQGGDARARTAKGSFYKALDVRIDRTLVVPLNPKRSRRRCLRLGRYFMEAMQQLVSCGLGTHFTRPYSSTGFGCRQ